MIDTILRTGQMHDVMQLQPASASSASAADRLSSRIALTGPSYPGRFRGDARNRKVVRPRGVNLAALLVRVADVSAGEESYG